MSDDIEKLLSELAPDVLERELLREEHRQLEKDLWRLVDPLPPANFLELVMSRVVDEKPLPSRKEIVFSVALVLGSLSIAALIFISNGMPASRLGISLASFIVSMRESLIGFQSAVSVIWKSNALLVSLVLVFTLISGSLTLHKILPSKEPV